MPCAFESGFDYDGNDLPGYPVPAASQAACCALCTAHTACKYYSYCTNGDCGATNCYLKSSNAGRKPWANRESGPLGPMPPANTITLAPCPSHYQQVCERESVQIPHSSSPPFILCIYSVTLRYNTRCVYVWCLQPGFDSLDDKGTYYAYNILAELDSEGEYYVNRTRCARV